LTVIDGDENERQHMVSNTPVIRTGQVDIEQKMPAYMLATEAMGQAILLGVCTYMTTRNDSPELNMITTIY
jgi:hypothetical protein